MQTLRHENVYNSKEAILLAGMSYQTYPFFESETLILPTDYQLRATIRGRSGVTDPAEAVFGFLAEIKEQYVLAFRGTANVLDIDSDLDLFQIEYPYVPNSGKTHRGITHIYQSLRAALFEELNSCTSSKELYVTGHSLGGDLAILASFDIAYNTEFKNPLLYTLAAGRIGDPLFASHVSEVVKSGFRIFNTHDFIPTLPGEEYPTPFTEEGMSYRHVGQDHAIDFQKDNMFLNHRINFYCEEIGNEDSSFVEALRTTSPGFYPDPID